MIWSVFTCRTEARREAPREPREALSLSRAASAQAGTYPIRPSDKRVPNHPYQRWFRTKLFSYRFGSKQAVSASTSRLQASTAFSCHPPFPTTADALRPPNHPAKHNARPVPHSSMSATSNACSPLPWLNARTLKTPKRWPLRECTGANSEDLCRRKKNKTGGGGAAKRCHGFLTRNCGHSTDKRS